MNIENDDEHKSMPAAARSLLQEVKKQSRLGIELAIANALFVQEKFQVLPCCEVASIQANSFLHFGAGPGPWPSPISWSDSAWLWLSGSVLLSYSCDDATLKTVLLGESPVY